MAMELERTWQEVTVELGSDWPAGSCVESSVMLRDELLARLPHVGAEYVWGEVVIGDVRIPHAWVALRDGTIVDPTAGQFLMTPRALRMMEPGTGLAQHYRELERPAHA